MGAKRERMLTRSGDLADTRWPCGGGVTKLGGVVMERRCDGTSGDGECDNYAKGEPRSGNL
jgi:hypothetical protein